VTHPDRPWLAARRTSRHVAPTACGDGATRHAPIGAARNRPSRHSSSHGKRIIRSGQDGFTLVELLVVVLVLGALVGIAVPTFIQQRDGAWDAAVRSELRAASIALASYRAQNGIYAQAALDSGAGWGYEPSPDIIVAVAFPSDGFCLRGWYRSVEPADVATGTIEASDLADERAEWVATPSGIASLADVSPKSCPA
jgi:prepilin-type N-terminal cleavage/methylation domain-containing protein